VGFRIRLKGFRCVVVPGSVLSRVYVSTLTVNYILQYCNTFTRMPLLVLLLVEFSITSLREYSTTLTTGRFSSLLFYCYYSSTVVVVSGLQYDDELEY
jgi:hypothetical protein